jgi:hypothetical protein
MSLSSSESDRFSTSGEEGPLGDQIGGLHEPHVLRVGEVRDVYELIELLLDLDSRGSGASQGRGEKRPKERQVT